MGLVAEEMERRAAAAVTVWLECCCACWLIADARRPADRTDRATDNIGEKEGGRRLVWERRVAEASDGGILFRQRAEPIRSE